MIAVALYTAAAYLSTAITPGGETDDIEGPGRAEPTGKPLPLSGKQKAGEMHAQLYVESVGPSDEKKRLDPLFGGIGSATMRGKKEQCIEKVSGLFRNGGKVSVGKLWDALREGMTSEDLLATDMTKEALLDLFGAEKVTLDQALEALTFARHMFAYRPDKYNFQSYRTGEEFVPLPAGFYEQVKSSPGYESYFKLLKDTPNFRAMVANLKRQQLGDKEAEEQARRIALTLLWNDFLDFCGSEGINLGEIKVGDALVAARLGKLVLQYEKGELGKQKEKIKAELELLKSLSVAGLGKVIKNKQDASASDPHLQARLGLDGIDFADDAVLTMFFDEFFGGRRDLSAGDMAEGLKKMGREAVAEKLDRIKEKSSRKTETAGGI